MTVDRWFDLFEGQDPPVPGHCIPAPLGCGEPLTGFTDEISESEYRITGLCQQCQDSLAAYAAEMEYLGIAWDEWEDE
jgi:hypothetical protein